jgi:CHAT domain-containing protein
VGRWTQVEWLFTALPRTIPCLWGLALCTALCTAQTPAEFHDLSAGNPGSLLLTSGSAADVRVHLGKAGAAEILLQTAATGIAYRLLSSDGTELQSGRTQAVGWLAIPFASAGQEQLRLHLSVSSLPGGIQSSDRSSAETSSVRVRLNLFHITPATLKSHVRAAQLQTEAQALYHSVRAEEVNQAIAKFQRAAYEWGRCGDIDGEAIALGGEAESQFELSKYSEATSTLDRAIGLDPGNVYLHSWLTHLKARAFLDEWEAKPARQFATISLRLGKQIRDPALIADAEADLAEADYWIGGQLTVSYASDGLGKARESGMPETAGRCLLVLAYMEEIAGSLSHAFSLLTEAEEEYRLSGSPRLALKSTGEFADIESRSGDSFGSLKRVVQLAEISKASGNLIDYGMQTESIGDEYELLGRPATANVYFHIAEKTFSSIHFRSGESLVRGKICDAQLHALEHKGAADSGLLQEALKNCKASLEIAQQIDDPLRLATALYQVGLVYRRMATTDAQPRRTQSDAQANVRALQLFTSAENKADSMHTIAGQTHYRISLGEVLEDMGKMPEARAKFEDALKRSTGGKDPPDNRNLSAPRYPAGVLEARYYLARWYSKNGQYSKAEETLKPALDQIEAERNSVSDSLLRATHFADERKCYELGIDLHMHEAESASERNALALELSERSRARGLLDALSARSAVGASSGGNNVSLATAKIAVDRAFDRRLKLQLAGNSKHELDRNTAELIQALGSLDRAEFEAENHSDQASRPATTMTTDEIKGASARSGDTYLEYELGVSRSYLWVIDQGQLTSYTLPPRAQIEDMVRKWRSIVTSGRGLASATSYLHGPSSPNSGIDLQQLSTRLSSVLLARALKPHMKRLIIVPDGDLAILPFAALPETASSSVPGNPLVAAHEIVLAPSLSVFLARKPSYERRDYKGEVAVMADPVFDQDDERFLSSDHSSSLTLRDTSGTNEAGVALPRLLNTSFEARAIEKEFGSDHVHLALGFDANLEALLDPEMQNYRIWHLATHGLYDEATPEFSGLVFSLVASDHSPIHGFLKAQDIAHMSLRPELVVLSACNSSAGEKVRGEGVMGLGYSFLHAGARSVISTLWSVDDSSSKQLMAAFYAEMRRNGNDSAGALRQSQLDLIHAYGSSAVYYWAGFQLTSVGQ